MDESETAHGEEVKTGLGASVGKCGQEPTCRNLQGVSHVRVRALIIVRVPKHNSPGETRESPAAGVEQSKGGEHGRRTPFAPGLYPDGAAQGPGACGASGGNLGAVWMGAVEGDGLEVDGMNTRPRIGARKGCHE